jgi:hypothetical protein
LAFFPLRVYGTIQLMPPNIKLHSHVIENTLKARFCPARDTPIGPGSAIAIQERPHDACQARSTSSDKASIGDLHLSRRAFHSNSPTLRIEA